MKSFIESFTYMSGDRYPEFIQSSCDILYDPIKNISELKIIYLGLQFYPCQYKGQIIEILDDTLTFLSPHIAKDFGKDWELYLHDGNSFKMYHIKSILRLELPEEHSHLFNDSKVILSRGMKYELGQKPTYIIEGTFKNHFHNKLESFQIHFWNGRIL